MPTINFPKYALEIQKKLNRTIAMGDSHLLNLHIDPRSSLRGYIAGTLRFDDASELHFREFVDMTKHEPRLMYAYHYQDKDQQLIFRYDNAAHQPALPQPEHKHTPDNIEIALPPTLAHIIDKIL